MRNIGLLFFKAWFAISISLVISSNTFAQGGCITENVSAPEVGYAIGKQVGRTFCAPPGGSIMRNQDGEIICAPGQCMRGDDGQTFCSSVPGGDVFVDDNGSIKCVEGCLRPAHNMCLRPHR